MCIVGACAHTTLTPLQRADVESHGESPALLLNVPTHAEVRVLAELRVFQALDPKAQPLVLAINSGQVFCSEQSRYRDRCRTVIGNTGGTIREDQSSAVWWKNLT